jgi:hypothetical protein
MGMPGRGTGLLGKKKAAEPSQACELDQHLVSSFLARARFGALR